MKQQKSMKRNPKSEKFEEILGELPERYIREVYEREISGAASGHEARRTADGVWRGVAVAAACIVLAVASVFAIPALRGGANPVVTPPADTSESDKKEDFFIFFDDFGTGKSEKNRFVKDGTAITVPSEHTPASLEVTFNGRVYRLIPHPGESVYALDDERTKITAGWNPEIGTVSAMVDYTSEEFRNNRIYTDGEASEDVLLARVKEYMEKSFADMLAEGARLIVNEAHIYSAPTEAHSFWCYFTVNDVAYCAAEVMSDGAGNVYGWSFTHSAVDSIVEARKFAASVDIERVREKVFDYLCGEDVTAEKRAEVFEELYGHSPVSGRIVSLTNGQMAVALYPGTGAIREGKFPQVDATDDSFVTVYVMTEQFDLARVPDNGKESPDITTAAK